MRSGRGDFEVLQEAYHDAYVRGEIELMSYLLHTNFFNVRAGAVKNKLEFIKLVELKIKKNTWYKNQSRFEYINLSKHEVGDVVSTSGILRIRGPLEKSIFSVVELWLFDPERSWKILSFVSLSVSPDIEQGNL